jgi:hypothetical protein
MNLSKHAAFRERKWVGTDVQVEMKRKQSLSELALTRRNTELIEPERESDTSSLSYVVCLTSYRDYRSCSTHSHQNTASEGRFRSMSRSSSVRSERSIRLSDFSDDDNDSRYVPDSEEELERCQMKRYCPGASQESARITSETITAAGCEQLFHINLMILANGVLRHLRRILVN